MPANSTAPKTMDDYIASFPSEVQEILQKVRATIKKAAPAAEETMSYKMPTFTMNDRYLIYFAAYKRHIGVYPAPVGNPDLQEEISAYQSGRGTLRFRLNQPIPYSLIAKIVKVRMKDNLVENKSKK